jgi:hypothetical protein
MVEIKGRVPSWLAGLPVIVCAKRRFANFVYTALVYLYDLLGRAD